MIFKRAVFVLLILHLNMVSGYWGEPNALKDFCEANYVVSYYFAEFFNSISAIPWFIQAVIGCYLTNKYATKEFRYKVCYFTLMFSAFGSFLFHATLQYKYQLLDSLPMLLCSNAAFYCSCTVHLPAGETNWQLAIMLIVVLLIELILYLGFHIWMVFFLGFSFNVVSATYMMSRHHRDVLGHYWIHAMILYYGGFTCWCIDQFFCDYVQPLQLHRFVHQNLDLYVKSLWLTEFENNQCLAYLLFVWIIFGIHDHGDCSGEIPQEEAQRIFVHCEGSDDV